MTRGELKAHCEREIEMCEFWAIGKGEKPSGKIYEEHKMILELLEQVSALDKIRAEIAAMDLEGRVDAYTLFIRTPEQVKQMALNIIDKYKAESEEV